MPEVSPTTTPVAAEVVSAAHALARHGLVTAYGHVSARIGAAMLITPPHPLSDVRSDALLTVPLDATSLPPGTPPEAWVHLAVYRTRPDVSAVARAMPPSGFAASSATTTVPVLHGQTAWLGDAVPVHPQASLLRTNALAISMAASLGPAHAVLLRGNGGVTTGESPGIAMARMYLLEAACRVWLEAARAGATRSLTTDEVAAWQDTSTQLLPRLWQFLAGS
jgi:HCOMODA/2-hydroxy-3-carboxy-muconic semialdehyde decarboxylase